MGGVEQAVHLVQPGRPVGGQRGGLGGLWRLTALLSLWRRVTALLGCLHTGAGYHCAAPSIGSPLHLLIDIFAVFCLLWPGSVFG